jgi:tetratricopeptide (TPR) repeat protein
MKSKPMFISLQLMPRPNIIALQLLLCFLTVSLACNRKTEPPTIADLPETSTNSTFNPDWKAATLKFASVTYGYVSKEMLIPLGTFNDIERIYEVLEVDSYYARITDGKNTGWVESSDLISFSPTIPPDSNEPGRSIHRWVGTKMTVINWDAELIFGHKIIGRLPVGESFFVSKGQDDWLFTEINGGGWVHLTDVQLFDSAVEYLTEKISADPTAENYNKRAVVYYRRGAIDRAIIEYTKAIELDSNAAYLYSNRGAAWGDIKNYDKAIADYTEMIRLDPNNATTFHNRGIVWFAQGNYEKAISDLTEAIHLKPNYPLAYTHRGIVWDEQREFEKAIADHTEAIRLDSNYAFAYKNRGDAWLDIQDYEKALADYNEALRLDPNYADAFVGRAEVMVAQNRVENAVEEFEIAFRVDPNNAECRGRLAWIFATTPKTFLVDGKRAVECAIQACELTDWIDDSHIGTLAAAYAARGKFDKALEFLDEAIEVNPHSHKETRDKMRAAFKARKRYIHKED